MAQHFLMSPQSKRFSVLDVARMSEEQAVMWFRKLRWSDTDGEPVCPNCGCLEHWELPSTGRWKCKGCKKQFSVTSDTLLAYHKKPLREYLFALAEFSNTAKSMAALELSRKMRIHYRTAWLWLQKFRSALFDQREEYAFDGVVEIDGCYTNGFIRPANRKEDRIDRRLAIHQNPGKRCILSFRERDPFNPGSYRTMTYVSKSENPNTISNIVAKHVAPGTEVHTDEHMAYEPLYAHYNLKQVNHNDCYVGEEGESNNQCESYNSRFKRMRYGVVHRMGVMYLDLYANEIAYREDTRRWSNYDIYTDLSEKCILSPVNNEFVNYCRGNGRVQERLA